ncbi:hypothetical protein [Azohydromonas lata]|uniref:Uncharacterized protein n=1 Tax=Azohydromonas lata TaxID=45677 RepID=A0ABU5I8L7_9BURK|nr:hypothetical protein [Azohydromonas lata]MDZ5454995.1 hypothetical protein [Azohydromonas lata]
MPGHFEHLDVGPAPALEDCAQVGEPDYQTRSVLECRVYRRMLQRLHPVPEGVAAAFVVREHPHEMGCYREVAIRYACPEALNFALAVEHGAPLQWDGVALYELAWFQRRFELRRAVREGRLTLEALPRQYAQSKPPELDAAALEELLRPRLP